MHVSLDWFRHGRGLAVLIVGLLAVVLGIIAVIPEEMKLPLGASTLAVAMIAVAITRIVRASSRTGRREDNCCSGSRS